MFPYNLKKNKKIGLQQLFYGSSYLPVSKPSDSFEIDT